MPAAAPVLLSAERFYPSGELFAWLQAQGWRYRLGLKGNRLVDTSHGGETTTGALAQGATERHLPDVPVFAAGVSTNLGILHEAGHKEPWIIAMDCTPTRAAVLDYGARWAIEPRFSDFKSRGFELEDSQLEHAERWERLILIMAVAIHWYVRVGRDDPMAEEFLDGADIVTVLQEMGGEGVAEGMAACRLGDAGVPDGLFDGVLQHRLGQVMTALDAAAGIDGAFAGRKDILPTPFPWSIRILPGQGEGQLHRTETFSQVQLVERLDPVQMPLARSMTPAASSPCLAEPCRPER